MMNGMLSLPASSQGREGIETRSAACIVPRTRLPAEGPYGLRVRLSSHACRSQSVIWLRVGAGLRVGGGLR